MGMNQVLRCTYSICIYVIYIGMTFKMTTPRGTENKTIKSSMLHKFFGEDLLLTSTKAFQPNSLRSEKP